MITEEVEKLKVFLFEHSMQSGKAFADGVSLATALNKQKDYHVTPIKRALILKRYDAFVVKLNVQGLSHPIGIKIHPDFFPDCKINYSPERREVINRSQLTTHVFDSFVVNIDGIPQRVVIYGFEEGTLLKDAKREGLINDEQQSLMISEIMTNVADLGVHLIVNDFSDFIINKNGTLKLLDWAKMTNET
ncbi:hypothetical protein SOPP22_15635 [Shewanella sp. OPT22]|nr:hypothetical protein SOPP22_15635 [Shewanella sp. OPT22]